MSITSGIPKGAAIAINDMLDNCARIKPGQEVLLLAQVDGLYGGDNMVDETAISWIQTAIQLRGAKASVLWIDEPGTPHAWKFSPVLKGALSGCDVLINHSFDLMMEEIMEFRTYIAMERKIPMIRNFATTASLLNTAWAQTPYELVSEIRYQSSLPIKNGLSWQLTDPNGTSLEGKIKDSYDPNLKPSFTSYSERRTAGFYYPWPEWVHPVINLEHTSGIFVFDCMLSWWSRYIGISPYFSKPIQLTINDGRIVKIEGGDEADSLKRFLTKMSERLGERVYDFIALHFGVHPQAVVAPQQCPNILYRRLIEHSHTCNVHVHIGAPPPVPGYPYWMHCTGDIRNPTFRVGDTLVHDRGYLTALDSPGVRAIAAKYPGRPGLEPAPRSF
jgi:hypothetical protein